MAAMCGHSCEPNCELRRIEIGIGIDGVPLAEQRFSIISVGSMSIGDHPVDRLHFVSETLIIMAASANSMVPHVERIRAACDILAEKSGGVLISMKDTNARNTSNA